MKNSTKVAIGVSILGIGTIIYFIIKGKKPVILGPGQEQQQKPEFQIRPPQQQSTTQQPAPTSTQPTRPPINRTPTTTTKPTPTTTTTKPPTTTKPQGYRNYDDYYGGFGGYGGKTGYIGYYGYGILDAEYQDYVNRDGARTYPTLKTM